MTLLADPVFQLNLTIWMLMASPFPNAWRPVFKEAGYTLEGIGRRFVLPIEQRAIIASLLGAAPGPQECSPDTSGLNAELPHYAAIECKGNSFTPESSSARQALVMLAVLFDVTDTLGHSAPMKGGVAYLTPDTVHERQADTLEVLRERLSAAGINPAPATAVGVGRTDDGITLVASRRGSLVGPLVEGIREAVVVVPADPDDDPRPLYFIPYVPNISQTDEELAYCEGAFRDRLTATAIRAIGEAHLGAVILRVDDLLSELTFGVFDSWRSRDDIHQIRLYARTGLLRLLRTVLEPGDVRATANELTFRMDAEEVRTALLEALAAFPSPKSGSPGQTLLPEAD